MALSINRITTCLWFNGEAEDAAKHYVSIFKNCKILDVHGFGEKAKVHGRDPDAAFTVVFELDGHRFMGLNGGPQFKFNEAVSFMVDCADQAEVDYFWEKLGEGGDESKRQCGWIQDRFGVWWQVVPRALKEMLGADDAAASGKAHAAMMQMKKLDVDVMKEAFEGK